MAYPTFGKFKKILRSADLEQILYLHVIEGTPYVFKANPERYQSIRKTISVALNIPMKNIIIVGSGRIGFSLNPNHFGTPFKSSSDVDIVVVSAKLFDTAWLELNRLESKWYDLTEIERHMVTDHIKYIYWGNIRPDKLPGTTEVSRLWLETFDSLGKIEEFSTRSVNGFLFRTWWQVQSFYLRGLRQLRSKVLGG